MTDSRDMLLPRGFSRGSSSDCGSGNRRMLAAALTKRPAVIREWEMGAPAVTERDTNVELNDESMSGAEMRRAEIKSQNLLWSTK